MPPSKTASKKPAAPGTATKSIPFKPLGPEVSVALSKDADRVLDNALRKWKEPGKRMFTRDDLGELRKFGKALHRAVAEHDRLKRDQENRAAKAAKKAGNTE